MNGVLKKTETKGAWDIEVKHLGDGKSQALVKCFGCKRETWVDFPTEEYRDLLRLSILKAYVCPACLKADEFEKQARQKEEMEKETEAAYIKRLHETNLINNYLGWDETHPGANIELFKWVEARRFGSMLLTGSTGLCKTRVLQYWGREAVQYQSVYYSTAAALLNKISAAYSEDCKTGDKFMEKIFTYDLLIIDDLGKEIGTNSQVGRLWEIFDWRYIRCLQEQDIRNGKMIPIYAKELNRSYGFQLWISTNLDDEDIFNRYERNYNRSGDPLLNRIATICENNIYE